MPITPLLEMRGITKRYPGVLALDHVNFSLQPGEVHALAGENGAGKSTLMKILGGAIQKDEGELLFNGKTVEIDSPVTSLSCGIGIIYQDFKLVPELSVAENIFLGHEPQRGSFIDFSRMHEMSRLALQQLGESIETGAWVKSLSVAQRQIIEIAKALSKKVRVLALDEPTASLTAQEIKNLFTVIRKLKSEGVGIIYISHRLDEIFEIADRITVLRDGAVVGSCLAHETDRSGLIQLMVGRSLEDEYPKVQLKREDEILRVENFTATKLKGVSLTLHRREILGIAGLVGAGRTELARAMFGADAIEDGTMWLEGKEVRPRSPREAISAGIGLLTEDRNLQGLVLQMTLRENISLTSLRELTRGVFINAFKEKSVAEEFMSKLQIKAPSTETSVETLSGGNRQKVILGRWLVTKSKVLIFDEPTVGIDVGVKYEIYNLINQLAKDGVGVIVISSDLPELLGICDRIAVMCEGRITGTMMRQEATQEKILKLATSFL
ncbi:MAG: sugar ABC transporter ATP-binding protein [Ignavibacteriales bacterium]|nr:sugar ABC transporter ATP-binding protein [Ignavibacteriales bacterium]